MCLNPGHMESGQMGLLLLFLQYKLLYKFNLIESGLHNLIGNLNV